METRTPVFAAVATGEFSSWATDHLLYEMCKKIYVITWTLRMTHCYSESQFSQGSDFHVIFCGDDPSLPIADTNIWLMPNKGDVLSCMIVPKSAWSSNLIGLFRIEIHILSCHTRTLLQLLHSRFFPYIKIRKPPFGRLAHHLTINQLLKLAISKIISVQTFWIQHPFGQFTSGLAHSLKRQLVDWAPSISLKLVHFSWRFQHIHVSFQGSLHH